MHVGLFGGSFNPPHLAHLIVAETVREQFALDAVWWMPAAVPPHKRADAVAPAQHRLEMTRLATAANPGFRVSREEVERGGSSYTVETLRVLQARHSETQFALILGGDSLAGFPSWRAPEEIARRAELLVYHRGGNDRGGNDRGGNDRGGNDRGGNDRGGGDAHADASRVADLPKHIARRVHHADAPRLEISGTALRERRRRGRSLRYLVPEPVRAYIAEHDLYTAAAHPAASA